MQTRTGPHAANRVAASSFLAVVALVFQSVPAIGHPSLNRSGVSSRPAGQIRLDTIARIEGREEDWATGTTVLDRVGEYFVFADLLEDTGVHLVRVSTPNAAAASLPDAPRFEDIRALRSGPGDSVAIIDRGGDRLSVASIRGGKPRQLNLPATAAERALVWVPGAFVAGTVSFPYRAVMLIRNARVTVMRVPWPKDLAVGDSYLERLSLLAVRSASSVWVSGFLDYSITSFSLEGSQDGPTIVRDPVWATSPAPGADWRYSSMLAIAQDAGGRMWTLGRSIVEPGVPIADPPGFTDHPLAGRERMWNLELEALAPESFAEEGRLTLRNWSGGFTSDGSLYLFEERANGRGVILVARPRLDR